MLRKMLLYHLKACKGKGLSYLEYVTDKLNTQKGKTCGEPGIGASV
jgi:hypothetical protein